MKFILRVLEYAVTVVIAGGLLIVAFYATTRAVRYTWDIVQREFSEEIEWIKSKLPKRKKKG